LIHRSECRFKLGECLVRDDRPAPDIDDKRGKAFGFFRNSRHPFIVDKHSLFVIFPRESRHIETITNVVAGG